MVAHYAKHAKKQEENGQFNTVFHDRLKELKAMLKNKKGVDKPRDIQAELNTPEYGDK